MAKLTHTEKNVEFIVLFLTFLDQKGQRRAEFFVEDGTHPMMNIRQIMNPRLIFAFKPEWGKGGAEGPKFYHFESTADYDTEQYLYE
jgi:hypothetical protein